MVRPRHAGFRTAASALLSLSAILPAAAQKTAAHAPPSAAEWSYVGRTGPSHWGSLPGDDLCRDGRRQSPIDLRDTETGHAALSAEYMPLRGYMFNNGHTVQMNVRPAGGLSLRGRQYALLQFHFHHPSEHRIEGSRAAGEVHFVHQTADGHYAVLGTLLWEAAQTNPAWEALLRQLPRQKGDTVQLAQPVDVRALLGMTDLSAEHPFLYDGSLTTPPCSEGIAWIVRSKGIYLSRAQLDMLRRAMPDDARPIQHRNGRPIIHRTR